MTGDNDKQKAAGAAIVKLFASGETGDLEKIELADYLAWPHMQWNELGKQAVLDLLVVAGLEAAEAAFIVAVLEIIHEIVKENADADIVASVRAFVDNYTGTYDKRIQVFARAIGWTGKVETPIPTPLPGAAPAAPAPVPAPAPAVPMASADPIEDALNAFVAFVTADDTKADPSQLAAFVAVPMDKLDLDGAVLKTRLRPKLKAVMADDPRRFAENLFSLIREKVSADKECDVVPFLKGETGDGFQAGWDGRIQAFAKAGGWVGIATTKPPPAAPTQPSPTQNADPFASGAADPFGQAAPSTGSPADDPFGTTPNAYGGAPASEQETPEEDVEEGDGRHKKGKHGKRNDEEKKNEPPPPPRIVTATLASDRKQRDWSRMLDDPQFQDGLYFALSALKDGDPSPAELIRFFASERRAFNMYTEVGAQELANFVRMWTNPARQEEARKKFEVDRIFPDLMEQLLPKT